MSQLRPPGAAAPAPQSAVAAAPGPDAAPAGAGPVTRSVATSSTATPTARPQVRLDTPRQLRRLTTALILVGLLLGLAGVLSFAGLAYSLDRAEANTAQLIRVQKIQTNLLSADATATSSFLVGGLEPPAQQAAYDQAITDTGELIAEASDAQPADAAALAALNQATVDYAVTIEQARANNRQGFPVGAAYLRNASSDLRSEALPLLDNLVAANSARAGDAMNTHVAYVFEVAGLLALAALVAAMVWVARRFRRRINTGLAAATAVVLVAWVVGFLVLHHTDAQADAIRTGSFRSVNSAADARIEANDAKSNESLTLIARGSGASFEQAWVASAGQVRSRLPALAQPDLSRSWAGYQATHVQIRKLDDGGSWDAAVRLATGTSATSANSRFAAFDTAASRFLQSVSSQTSNGLRAPRVLLVGFAVLTFLAGLAASLLARAGLAQRLREYR